MVASPARPHSMRAAIDRELAGRESGADAAEEHIAASLDRLAREIRSDAQHKSRRQPSYFPT
jgi:hypothetical protein